MGGVTRHLADEKERNVAQLQGRAGLDCERGYGGGRDLGNEFAEARCDGCTGLVELVFPEHAGEDAAAECLLGGEDGGGRALVGARAGEVG